MAECVVCGHTVPVSATCPHCARPACPDHREPDSHECGGIRADRTAGWIIDLDGRDAGDRSGPDATDGTEGPARTGPDRTGGAVGADDAATGTDGRDVLWDLLGPGRWLAAATVLLVAVVLLAAGLHLGSATAIEESRAEHRIAQEVNEARSAAGVGTLAYNETLARVAGTHSGHMATRGYVSHESPDGAGLAERYARFGLTCPGGENVYYGPRGGLASSERTLAEHVVRSWLDSPGHRETLLKDRFDRQGIGVVITDDGRLYVTQDLC